MTHLPVHPTLRHPRTGEPLRAIGVGKRGPIWPAIGASDDPPPADPPQDPPADPPADEPLREPGKKALQAERERADAEAKARKELEQKLAKLAPLEQIADLLGGKPTGDGKTDLERLTERLSQHETDLASEREARWRSEVALEKGLSLAQAARLQGGTKEELLADADALLELFPAAPSTGPRTPAPDPSQGSRGTPPPSLDSQIAAAQAKGDWRTVLSLQNQKLAEQANK